MNDGDPQADIERRIAAWHLLMQPLTCEEHDPSAFRLIRRHEAELSRWFTQRLGYRLHLDADTARLFKSGAVIERRPLRTTTGRPLTQLEYTLLALALAANVAGPSVISLRDLVDEIRSTAAEADVALPGDATERRALVTVLRWMIDHGLADEMHEHVDAYTTDDEADAVLRVRPDRIALLAPATAGSETADELLQRAERRSATRQWMRVRLVEDSVLYRDELTDDEWAELRRRLGEEERQLDEMFGLVLEARAEGVAMIDPAGVLADRRFPSTGTLGHAALLVIERLVDDGGTGAISHETVTSLVSELAEQHSKRWSQDYVDRPERFARDVTTLLCDVHLAEMNDNSFRLLPAAARFKPIEPTAEIDDRQGAVCGEASELAHVTRDVTGLAGNPAPTRITWARQPRPASPAVALQRGTPHLDRPARARANIDARPRIAREVARRPRRRYRPSERDRHPGFRSVTRARGTKGSTCGARDRTVGCPRAAREWPEPWATEWIDEVIGAGLPKGLDGTSAGALIKSVRRILDRLDETPTDGSISRTDLAAGVLGSSHALDRGTALEAVVARALTYRTDAELIEGAWERARVHTDQVSGAALTWALPVLPSSGLHPVVTAAAEARVPIHLTRYALSTHPVRVEAGTAILVTENPRAIEAAAQRSTTRATITTNGNPSAAVRLLLDQLLTSGATLLYHGDFDVPGLAICARMQQLGLSPWLMDSANYRAAVDSAAADGVDLPIETRTAGVTPWDPSLRDAMNEIGRIVHEERLLDDLLE